MNLLNLNLVEFLGLAGFISAGIVALYLLDRSRRKQVVATLRFWAASQVPTEWKRSRRIQQPWSLLLQLVSMLLLLLAIAGPRLGGNFDSFRNHVVILDISAWMGARARQGILLDQSKAAAISYVKSLPGDDRVMLVRADALATPVTPFSSNHDAIVKAIQESQPSASALNLQQALEFAEHAQRLQQQRPGEIIFAGAGRVSREEADSIVAPKNLRVLQIPSAGENAGLKKLSVRRSPESAGLNEPQWDAFVAVKNDGTKPREIILDLRLGRTIVGTKTMTIAPGTESEATFRFKKDAQIPDSTPLEARIRSANGRADAFPQDDRAVLDLPAESILHVTIYSNEPQLLRPLVASNPRVMSDFKTPAQYDPRALSDIVIFDRFAPPQTPRSTHIVWIDPPPGAPFGVRGSAENVRLERWHSEHPLAAGLYTRDVELPSAKIFSAAKGDEVIAEAGQGPVIIARTSAAQAGATETKQVAMGFHPSRSALRYELATPLLMANILHWMAPETFRRSDVQASTVGTISVPLEKGTDRSSIRVTDENKRPLPFTVEHDTLRFFSGAPGIVHVLTGDGDTQYSLNVPDVADAIWKPPSWVKTGPGSVAGGGRPPTNLWPWLAVLGGLGLLIEWLLYGRSSILRVRARSAQSASGIRLPWRKAS